MAFGSTKNICRTSLKTYKGGGLDTNEVTRLAAIRHVMATIFSAQNALRELAPEYKWAGMGNLLGDYGELVAVSQYNLSLAPSGSDGFDAYTQDGKTVQIKANHSSGTIGFRGEADYLLVLKVNSDGSSEEMYFGPFALVSAASSFSKRDNKRTISTAKLRKLAEEVVDNE